MKRRLFTVATAALLAVGVALPATVQPAAAVDPVTVITVIKGVYDTISKYFGGDLSTQSAVDQIKAAIAQAQTQIIDEIDEVAAANVQACAESAVINYADIDSLGASGLQSYALTMTDCVTLADSLLPTLTDKAAVDAVGFALESVSPLALMGRAKAGLSTTALQSVIMDGSNVVLSKLAPTCTDTITFGAGGAETEHYYCTAYNGTRVGQDAAPGVIDYGTWQTAATANTSRAVAAAALTAMGHPPSPGPGPCGGFQWPGGTTFNAGMSFRNCRGWFQMQTDGNLVLYNENTVPIWSSNTSGNPGAFASFQGDGNLVVYTAAHRAIWASNTAGAAAGGFLAYQADGNLVIYNAASHAVYASNTVHT